jgi:hypothetical protein
VAVKKVTAKKSVAKKAAAKKSIAKKTPAKKSVAKKSAVKKSTPKKAAKKSVAKKSAVKKSTPKKAAKKPVAKKSAVKKSTPKKAVKKSTTKKTATKKSAIKKSSVERIVIPEAPITARPSRLEIVSTPSPVPAPAPVAGVAPVQPTASAKKQGASGRVIFAVVVGIIVLGLIVWGQSNNSNDDAVKPTPSASPTATAEASATPTPTAVIISTHEAPLGVVAHYTPTGATIFWKVPNASDGLTGYNIEISLSNGPWKLISTVPATQLYLDVTKESGTGWTSFRVSSVYSDGEATPAKAFGLPGTYS